MKSTNNKCILVGAFSEMVELCELCNISIVGIIDNIQQGSYRNIPILGNDNNARVLFEKYGKYPLVLTPDSPHIRQKLANHYKAYGWTFCNVISPTAMVSNSAFLGNGIVIQSGCNISSNTIIGDFVKINTQSNVMHDCNIGAYTTIAPRAVVLGRINIGELCYIGANSTILPSLSIGSNSIVGAGAVVTKDISESRIVKGIPAK